MSGLVPFNNKNQSALKSSKKDFFNDMLEDFFTDNWFMPRNLMSDTFKIDVEDKENEYLIYAELPGVKKEELTLNFDDGRLTISINHEENAKEERKNYIHRERRISSMSRSIYLDRVETDNVEAKLENGILSIKVPKTKKKDESKKIEIK